jgi:hypothetical protein
MRAPVSPACCAISSVTRLTSLPKLLYDDALNDIFHAFFFRGVTVMSTSLDSSEPAVTEARAFIPSSKIV